MRKVIISITVLFLMLGFMQAQTDTMYVMKLGDIIGKYNIQKEIDSITFVRPEDPNSAYYIARVNIPAGSFTMGSSDTEINRNDDETQHTVTLTDFCMSRYEITNEQFANFLNEKAIKNNGLYASGLNPSEPLIKPYNLTGLIFDGLNWVPVSGYEKYPVVFVTWYGANEFAAYAGGTLPTEAQWEYACRANTSTTFNTGSCFSYTDGNYNWTYPYNTCPTNPYTSPGKPKSVGLYAPNAFGLFDMHGNVLEWCSDWHGDYPSNSASNPTGAETGSRRIHRGGSWISAAKYCRSAWRGNQTPNFSHQSVGFRVVFPVAPKIENHETLYVMKAGAQISNYNVINQVDSIVFYRSKQESISRFPGFLYTNDNISIFVEALKLTGLSDSLRKVGDESYKPTQIFRDEYGSYEIVNPNERRYRYTVFIEDNDVLKANGINSLQDLIEKAKELYPSGFENDFTNRNNSLNQYIAYHLVNKVIYYNKFFYTRNAISQYVPDEFIETMLPNRIIRASKINNRITLNSNSEYTVKINDSGSQTTVNGVYHLLDEILAYTPSVEEMLQNTRIRFDVTSLFPEMTNNNIRASEGFMSKNNVSGDRFGFEQNYLTGIKFSAETRLIYLSAKDKQWANYQADELMALGTYDVTLRLLPVPTGTYEIRYAYTPNQNRSVTQIYVDDKPIGTPIDLRISANNPKIGWLLDSTTEDNGVENDKAMRNKGYMKGPNTYRFQETLARNYSGCLRRIVGTFTFNEYQAHTLRFQCVDGKYDGQLMLDYIEIVPKSIYAPASGEPESRD